MERPPREEAENATFESTRWYLRPVVWNRRSYWSPRTGTNHVFLVYVNSLYIVPTNYRSPSTITRIIIIVLCSLTRTAEFVQPCSRQVGVKASLWTRNQTHASPRSRITYVVPKHRNRVVVPLSDDLHWSEERSASWVLGLSLKRSITWERFDLERFDLVIT